MKSKMNEKPSSVLMCGNLSLMDHSTLKLISDYYNVIVAGENLLPDVIQRKPNSKIHVYKEETTSENFEKLVFSYSPSVIWYFSGFVDGGDGLEDEHRKITELCRICDVNEISKLVIISSVNSLNIRKVGHEEEGDTRWHYITQKAFDCAQMEQLVSYVASEKSLKVITVRVPYIYMKTNAGNYLGELFQNTAKGSVSFPYNEREKIDFLSAQNLTELLISISEETMDTTGEYVALSGFEMTYGKLGSALKKCNNALNVNYEESSFFDVVINEKLESERLRKGYGFIPTGNLLDDIESVYDDYRQSVVKKDEFADKAKKILTKITGSSFKVAELIILFIVVQLLVMLTYDNVYFKFVDLRLFYVLILGTTHGMFIGILAGILECISLIFAYSQQGVTGTMLFYNMDYWLPFAIYLMTGAITGYLVTAKNQRLKFAEEEVFNLQKKYLFLNDVYMSVIDNKEEYKRQILGFQDSFGKIFEAVEALNSSTPADIFMNGVETIERILDNHSIAIYTLDEWQNYGRLVACSRELSGTLAKSLKIADCKQVYDVIVREETWKNTDFIENLPIYSYAIVEQEKVRLMISIYEAGPEQMGLYYMNLFTILGNLIRVSFLRALEYQEAIESEKYMEGTDILLPEYFEKELDSQRKMANAGVASYILLKINTDDMVETSHNLRGLIRHSDILGIGNDKVNYLLLTQTNMDIFNTIGERFTNKGIDYTIMEGM